jgi:hypothetical protein
VAEKECAVRAAQADVHRLDAREVRDRALILDMEANLTFAQRLLGLRHISGMN